jgi:uncharacterized protein
MNEISKMENLLKQSVELVARIPTDFTRYLTKKIEWSWRLIGIKGARGTGKTTMLLQYLRENFDAQRQAIYLSLDHLFFASHTLFETIEHFRTQGFTHFFLDEVHKYPDWSREIKQLYDLFSDIHLVFTGSSIIEFNKLDVDLSRRALIYELRGLSYREYLAVKGIADLPVFTLENLLENHVKIALEIGQKIRPNQHFQAYLRVGYYPYFLENSIIYHQRLAQTVNLVIETDLQFLEKIETKHIRKIFQLLAIIASSVPFKPNIQKLAERIVLDRNTLLKYLYFLEKSAILRFLGHPAKGISLLQKPEKIYLENTNLAFAIAPTNVDIGNLRETFFLNQISHAHSIFYPEKGDFWVAEKWTFEIGGRGKTATQIKHIEQSFIAADDIEMGIGNQIPLWLFGFLY